jgi:hypothetical protein
MGAQTTLLLDVDGVLNYVPPGVREGRVSLRRPDGSPIHVYPTPRSVAFLQAVAAARWLRPLWLTAWGPEAHLWNDYSHTPQWPCASSAVHAQRAYYRSPRPVGDWKSFVAEKVLRKWSGAVVWLEDGFLKEARTLATAQPRLALVDVTPEPMRTWCRERETRAYTPLCDRAHAVLHHREAESAQQRAEAVTAFLEALRGILATVERREEDTGETGR